MNPLPIVRASLSRNPLTVILFSLLIALAVALGIAISVQERALRQGSARAADRFDLIVAAPGSQTDILLSTVYLRPTAVELLPGAVVDQLLHDDNARFVAPVAFGDSYRDSPVIGTTAQFVTYLSDGLAEGQVFAAMDQAVVGALVDVRIGQTLQISHGHADDMTDGSGDADSYQGADNDHDHDHAQPHEHDHAHGHEPVTVTGRMQPTGTPWDKAVVVPVEYIWNAHVMGTGHAPGDPRIGPPWDPKLLPGLPALVVKPKTLAGAYGMRSEYRTAQSTAFFPAETLVQLYDIMGGATRVMSWLTLAAQVLVVGAILGGMLAVLDLQRQRFAVLRALGASAGYVFASVWLYVGAMMLAGAVLGLPLGWAASAIATMLISQATGVAMTASLSWTELRMAATLLGLGCLLALIPALRIYRAPVVDNLR
ncbi:FtsX-like permease family protein [Paracoccus shanxieyensis]|uniref:FtsX-like permease family protein n=1 Tax=Paracoccus shanxieyensis TaxID=2675752 RepID=A0A6L6IS77_9RHOB|nr:ABC transporter permease [Paracoccus shanxieyensis]MTH62719.1 FtsX-like permease family protein [Paracoccus shanxieyensis]MTH86197.1 FtsX-like permease family protein [Paracoccus shanxieyensis]